MANTADVNLGRYNVGGVDRFRVSLTRDGATWVLGPSAVVTFTFKAPDRMTVFTRTAVIENGPGGLCYYDTIATDITVPGWWELGVTVNDGNGVQKPYPYSIGFNVASQPH